MKIEILLVENINEVCKGMTTFEAEKHIADAIQREKAIKGIVIIDDSTVKFSFSSFGMDGDIFTSNDSHRAIVKRIVPLFVYNKKKK